MHVETSTFTDLAGVVNLFVGTLTRMLYKTTLSIAHTSVILLSLITAISCFELHLPQKVSHIVDSLQYTCGQFLQKQQIFALYNKQNFTEIVNQNIKGIEERVLSELLEERLENESQNDYYTANSQNWPIDLDQYSESFVIRITSEDEFIKYLIFKEAKALHISIWEQSVGLIDLKVDRDQMHRLLYNVESRILERRTRSVDSPVSEYKVQLMIGDLPQRIYETYPSTKVTSLQALGEFPSFQNLSNAFFEDFRTLETIYDWFEEIQKEFPKLVSINWIGQTYEGRDLKALHVRGKHSGNKTVVVTGGMHAREWISVTSACYAVHKLLQNYADGHHKEAKYLDKLDFLFVPVLNPDGYEYSFNEDRLWRKNRQETYMPRCFGIDIDHSFDYHFVKSEDLPCGEEYSGESPFESIESEVWNNFLNRTKEEHKIYGYIDLHSYSQTVLYPYAYSCEILPRDEENLIELGYGIARAIRKSTGKKYQVLKACEDRDADLLPDLGGGTALDYMYHNRAYWAFQIKLRDSGNHGFLLPKKFIYPVGTEVYASIQYFCSFVLNLEG